MPPEPQRTMPSEPKQTGRPKLPEGSARVETIHVRARTDWTDWLARFAAHCGLDRSDLIDAALEAHARKKGFEAPPRR